MIAGVLYFETCVSVVLVDLEIFLLFVCDDIQSFEEYYLIILTILWQKDPSLVRSSYSLLCMLLAVSNLCIERFLLGDWSSMTGESTV